MRDPATLAESWNAGGPCATSKRRRNGEYEPASQAQRAAGSFSELPSRFLVLVLARRNNELATGRHYVVERREGA